MSDENVKLLTVYTEAALESSLVDDIDRLGAVGYTITNARGKGSSGERTAAWDANSNIRIEIICEEQMARNIAEYLQTTYYDNYAMVTFISEIEVLRPEKFGAQADS
jgi:hypothetical protein